jgi:hypothetical protein
MQLDLPTGPGELSPGWLTAALRASGTIRDAAVAELAVEEVGPVQGFAGRVVRVRVRYDRAEAAAPASLVAKFGHPDPQIRAWLNSVYARELRFYREVAPTCPVRTPRLYHGAADAASDTTAMLFEDLGHLRVGDVVAGCSNGDAFLAVGQMARLHAAWWDDPRLAEPGWLNRYAEGAAELHETYARCLPEYLRRLGAIAPPSVLELVDRLAESVERLRVRLGTGPCTFAHGDFRLDNLFFGTTPHDPSLVVGDWHAGSRARGVVDLGCFVATGLGIEQRRSIDRGLIEHYHRELVAGGVVGYSLDECFVDYRLALLNDLANTMIAASSVDLNTDRLPELARTSFERWTQIIADHRLADHIPGR